MTDEQIQKKTSARGTAAKIPRRGSFTSQEKARSHIYSHHTPRHKKYLQSYVHNFIPMVCAGEFSRLVAAHRRHGASFDDPALPPLPLPEALPQLGAAVQLLLPQRLASHWPPSQRSRDPQEVDHHLVPVEEPCQPRAFQAASSCSEIAPPPSTAPKARSHVTRSDFRPSTAMSRAVRPRPRAPEIALMPARCTGDDDANQTTQ